MRTTKMMMTRRLECKIPSPCPRVTQWARLPNTARRHKVLQPQIKAGMKSSSLVVEMSARHHPFLHIQDLSLAQ